MHIALWIAAGFLSVAFLVAGLMKVTTPRPEIAEKGMTYVEDFSDAQIKAIGILEVLGAIGLVVPAFVPGLTLLVPIAATALLVVMICGIVVHVRRSEPFTSALVLGLLCVVVAVGRFWVAPF